MTVQTAADLAHHLPPGCATFHEMGGPLAWSEEQHTLAALAYLLKVANWQRTKDGQKGNNPPQPIEPPKSKHEQEREAEQLNARAEAFRRRQELRRQQMEAQTEQ